MYEAERTAIVAAAQTLIACGGVSQSLHGNISVRPGRSPDHLVMTGSALAGLEGDDLAVLDLDAAVIEGRFAPTELEVVGMHTAFYRSRPETVAVVHTHSPHATAFAAAGTPLPCVAESLARWGIASETPVAKWAPRGSEASVSNIVATLESHPASPAVLLENHGVLVSGASLDEAVRRVIALEENAQLAVLATSLGGAQPLDEDQIRSALARKQEFLRP